MNETQLLDNTLELLGTEGPDAACQYLERYQEGVVTDNRSQIENFRYCLAAVCGEKERSLHILENAIRNQGFWYRPQVFEDEDLKSLWDDPLFRQLKDLSEERYRAVLANSVPVCTWREKNADKLLLSLHGNQENLHYAERQWEFLEEFGVQVEYFQSGEPDSSKIFRWEADGPGAAQLARAASRIPCRAYRETIFAGFSAGCNVIARAIAEEDLRCGSLVFIAPWLPSFDSGGFGALCEKLTGTDVLVVCGEKDDDCMPGAIRLKEEINGRNGICRLVSVPGLGHGFPSNFREIILGWLAGKSGKE